MVEVHLWSGLRPFAGGLDRVEVEAKTIGQMLARLKEAYPGLGPAIDAGVSVAIDGRIIASSLTEAVGPDNEIYLMQRLRGGERRAPAFPVDPPGGHSAASLSLLRYGDTVGAARSVPELRPVSCANCDPEAACLPMRKPHWSARNAVAG